jgi:hypothetical protein
MQREFGCIARCRHCGGSTDANVPVANHPLPDPGRAQDKQENQERKVLAGAGRPENAEQGAIFFTQIDAVHFLRAGSKAKTAFTFVNFQGDHGRTVRAFLVRGLRLRGLFGCKLWCRRFCRCHWRVFGVHRSSSCGFFLKHSVGGNDLVPDGRFRFPDAFRSGIGGFCHLLTHGGWR